MVRVCKICKKEKPIEDFYFRNDSKTYKWKCKSCAYAQTLSWARNNREKRNATNRKHYQNNLEVMRKRGKESTYITKYGITIEEKRQMLIDQDYKCAICNKEFTGTHDSNVDHNHKTKQVRGLLCRDCNMALGHIENEEFYKKAQAYLEKHSESS